MLMRSVAFSLLCLVEGVQARASAGQPVELAQLLVEHAGRDHAAHGVVASGACAGGVAQLRLGVGRGRDDLLGDDDGVVAVLDAAAMYCSKTWRC
jgi:hypothetical protein